MLDSERVMDALSAWEPSKNTFDQFDIRSVKLSFNDAGVSTFNEIFNLCKTSKMRKITRTPGGAIKTSDGCRLRNMYAYDVRKSAAAISITILIGRWAWSFYIGHYAAQEIHQSGHRAFEAIKRALDKDGIDIYSYQIKNGREVKKEIPAPKIFFYPEFKHCITEHAHHIDFHSSYAAGLANTHPEMRKTLERVYGMRSVNKIYKLSLNATIGYFQSVPCCGARWAHLSRDAISDNNRRVDEMAERLRASGRTIIGFNTDGIWYTGEVYHGEGEGKALGEWLNDFVDCRFRAKSDGIYEFQEPDGTYHPVVRGVSSLDKKLDRSMWRWGDIFQVNNEIVQYYFDPEEGIISKTEKIETEKE